MLSGLVITYLLSIAHLRMTSKLRGLGQQTSITSGFLWTRDLGTAWLSVGWALSISGLTRERVCFQMPVVVARFGSSEL